MGVTVYAISPSSPQEHELFMMQNDIHFEIFTDLNYEFGERFGFLDLDSNSIYRGYVGANPTSEKMVVEVDYLVGQGIEKVLDVMEGL